MRSKKVTTLFLDIGGVMLTNGWDRDARAEAARKFGYPLADMESRHERTFGTYEMGKISLNEYLDRTVFYKERPFSRNDYKVFMFSRSKPYLETIELVRGLKARYKLKTVAVSNEGREIALYRNKEFGLPKLVDFFVCSCFVGMRKPDTEMYLLALDLAQVRPTETVYVENTDMFVEIARGLGLRTILHRDAAATAEEFRKLGLRLD